MPNSSDDTYTLSRNSRLNFFHHTISPLLIPRGLAICLSLGEYKLMLILASSAHRNEGQMMEEKRKEGKTAAPKGKEKLFFYPLFFCIILTIHFISLLYLASLNTGLKWYWTDYASLHWLSLLAIEPCIHGKWVSHRKLFVILISNMA